MRLHKVFLAIGLMLLLCSSQTAHAASDFDWMPNFNRMAEANLSDFRARLAARFQIGPAQVEAVISKVGKAADAYMVLRLGEMSSLPTEHVLNEYRSGKAKGWGALAKSLGIKPGSKEFHALKRSDDLYGEKGKGKGDGKDKGDGKGKGKDKGKDKGKGKSKGQE